MASNEGFVLLYRKTIDSRVFQNANLYKVWSWCLCKASHKEQWVPMQTGRGITEVHIYPGQFIFGRKVAAKELLMKPSSVRNRMEKLKNMRNVDIQPDRHYSVITILNWDIYQNPKKQNGQASGQAKDNQRTTKGQPKDTYNNVNNDNNDNNVNKDSLSGADNKNEPDDEIFLILPCKERDKLFPVTESVVKKWEAHYPEVNVRKQFGYMAAWFDANPVKTKAFTGMNKFINHWLLDKQVKIDKQIEGAEEERLRNLGPGYDPNR